MVAVICAAFKVIGHQLFNRAGSEQPAIADRLGRKRIGQQWLQCRPKPIVGRYIESFFAPVQNLQIHDLLFQTAQVRGVRTCVWTRVNRVVLNFGGLFCG